MTRLTQIPDQVNVWTIDKLNPTQKVSNYLPVGLAPPDLNPPAQGVDFRLLEEGEAVVADFVQLVEAVPVEAAAFLPGVGVVKLFFSLRQELVLTLTGCPLKF